MPVLEFSEEKNIFLKQTRGVNFEDVLDAVHKGNLLDDIQHGGKKYVNQRIFIVKMKDYAYAVPYVQNEAGTIFLKTLYPSRVFTKRYLKKEI